LPSLIAYQTRSSARNPAQIGALIMVNVTLSIARRLENAMTEVPESLCGVGSNLEPTPAIG